MLNPARAVLPKTSLPVHLVSVYLPRVLDSYRITLTRSGGDTWLHKGLGHLETFNVQVAVNIKMLCQRSADLDVM